MSGAMTAGLGEPQLDALRELANIGAGTAATALSEMTGAPVAISVPRVSVLPVERIPHEVGGGDTLVAAILLWVSGEVEGHVLFTMRDDPAREVVSALMGGIDGGVAHPDTGGFTELELSALQEVGNILTASYLGAMAELTGLSMRPSPPAVGFDTADALLGSALAEVEVVADTALLIETSFSSAGAGNLGEFLFLPTPEALETLIARLVLP